MTLSDSETQEYFDTFGEETPDNYADKNPLDLGFIEGNARHIKRTVSKPHKCSSTCPCLLILANIDIMLAHIEKVK